MRRRPFRIACAIAAGVILAWTTPSLADPVVEEKATIPVPGQAPVAAHVFTVAPEKARIRVLTSGDLKNGTETGRGVSVREAAETALVGRVVLAKALLVNGGYSESPTSRPAGLLVSDGAVVSLPNHAIRRADPHNSCPLRHVDRHRLPGVLCIARDGAVSIVDLATGNPMECREAIQAGPMLVEKAGEAAICTDNTADQYARTAVCKRGQQMLVVVTQAPISLYALASWLSAPAGPQGLGCERAINLSGDTSSGAVYYPGGLSSKARSLRAGSGTYPLASLILVQSRKLP
jgi:uncharacterized protein YigE (DUF2233 family)